MVQDDRSGENDTQDWKIECKRNWPGNAKAVTTKNVHEIQMNISPSYGVGQAAIDKNIWKRRSKDMTQIAGQNLLRPWRVSQRIVQIRQGMPIGAKVTLRGKSMYEFLDRLVTIALPRVRDFRGINGKAFDGRGNYALGIRDHTIFLEINFEELIAWYGYYYLYISEN